MADLATLSIDDFISLVQTNFNLNLGQGSIPLKLIEASPLKHKSGPKGARAPFSLIFQGPTHPELQQGIYPLSGRDGFDQSIFLVPIAREELGMIYQAVFN